MKGCLRELWFFIFDMIFIIDHYGREQTKKINDGDVLRSPPRPPLAAPGKAKGDLNTPHDGIKILKSPPLFVQFCCHILKFVFKITNIHICVSLHSLKP